VESCQRVLVLSDVSIVLFFFQSVAILESATLALFYFSAFFLLGWPKADGGIPHLAAGSRSVPDLYGPIPILQDETTGTLVPAAVFGVSGGK